MHEKHRDIVTCTAWCLTVALVIGRFASMQRFRSEKVVTAVTLLSATEIFVLLSLSFFLSAVPNFHLIFSNASTCNTAGSLPSQMQCRLQVQIHILRVCVTLPWWNIMHVGIADLCNSVCRESTVKRTEKRLTKLLVSWIELYVQGPGQPDDLKGAQFLRPETGKGCNYFMNVCSFFLMQLFIYACVSLYIFQLFET